MSPLPPKLAIVDLETTGGNFLLDRIIEVGILRIENGIVTQTYASLVNPLCSVPPEIVGFTGINPMELETAPTFDQIASDIRKLISDSVFVAHNSRFDYSFLRNEFLRTDHKFIAKNLCTVKLSRTLFPNERHHNLTSIIERYGLTCANRHRALGDAQAVWDFLQHILKTVDPKIIETAIKTVFRRPAKPAQISEKLLDSLPDGPGVYLFYGGKTTKPSSEVTDLSAVALAKVEWAPRTVGDNSRIPLYIGKSRDIRSRVLDHFSDSISSPRKLQLYQQVQDIDFIETAGDLGAQLLESSMIKKLQPLYNRQLRNTMQLTIVSQNFNLKTTTHLDYDAVLNSWGVFRRKSQAKKILQDVTANCWLKGCKGGVIHKLHRQMAFSHSKIKPWPFAGQIAIPEENLFTKKSAVHIFHLWSHLGTYESLTDLPVIPSEMDFSLDTYHILHRYLRQPNPRLHLLPHPTNL